MWEAALAGVEGELDEDDSVTIGLLRGARRNDASRYGVSAKRRHARILQIFGIVRKYDVFGGITPVKFRRMLEELGPTFVKAGQILSMRSEILPERFCSELTKLRSDVDPMPYETVIAVLEQEYGGSSASCLTPSASTRWGLPPWRRCIARVSPPARTWP